MKKLKKVLSLVLVLAMALSVFGVCASAANVEDYADADEITYTEAVGVLSGLGVLIGDDDGSFHPGNTLLREQAAKIASYLIGLQDQVTQGPTFSDVAEDNWAKGYIAICEANGLIAGNGDGTFAPEGTLTGYEWEKIVICALGYDAAKTNMLGDSWQGGVAALANELDLLDGLNEDYDAGRAITREEAAQIAFNALSRGTVKYSYSDSLLGTPTGVTLGEKIFHLSVKNTFDVFGAPVAKVYYNNKTNKEYASFAYSAVASYDNEAKGVKAAKIEADLEDAGVKNPTVEYYVDGVTGTVTGGRGVDVSVYKYTNLETGKDVYRAVEINTYVEVLDDESAYTKEDKNANGTVTAAAYYTLDKGTAKTNKNAYLPAEGFKDKDIITYNVGDEENLGKPAKTVAVNAAVQTLVGGTATTVSYDGSKTAAANGYVAFDKGDKLYYSKNYAYAADLTKVEVNKYYGTVYDNYGNIIYITEAERQTVSDKGHLFVIEGISYYTDGKTENVDGSLFQPVLNPVAKAQALVVLYNDESASVEVVDLAIGQVKNEFKLLDKYGYANGETLDVDLGEALSELRGKFAEYYVTDDGEYIIEACADAKNALKTTKANETIDADSTLVLANTATKFTYITLTNDPYTKLTHANIEDVAKAAEVTVETVTGYTNLKGMAAAKVGYLETSKTTGYATVGAVISNTYTNCTAVYGMFDKVVETSDKDGELYQFIGSDGQPMTFYAEMPSSTDIAKDTSGLSHSGITGDKTQFTVANNGGKVYKLTINTNGKIVGYSELTGTNKVATHATKVVWASGEGYVKSTAAHDGTGAIVSTNFYSKFGGKAYDTDAKAFIDVTKLDASQKYVELYVDDADKEPAGVDALNEIVFVKVVTDNYVASETRTVDATYKRGVGFVVSESVTLNANNVWNASAADALSVTGVYANNGVDNAKGTAIGYDDAAYYDGQQFKISYTYSRDCDGTEAPVVYSDAVTAIQNAGLVYLHDDNLKSRAAGILAADGTLTKLTRVSNSDGDGVAACTDTATACKYYVYDASKNTLTEATVTVSTDDHHTLLARFNGCSNANHYSYAVYIEGK